MSTTVTVAQGWLIFADGTQHTEGSVLTVPTAQAKPWITAGWATVAPEGKPRTAAKR